MAAEVYVARSNAIVFFEGRRLRVARGQTTVREGHPLLEAHPGLFEPQRVQYDVDDVDDVEQATARPGEQRATEAPDTKAMREWAKANGHDVPRGKPLPPEVVEAYQAAHAGGGE